MKKISTILLTIAVVSAFSFASYNSIGVSRNFKIGNEFDNLKALKGAEKVGLSQSNQNW